MSEKNERIESALLEGIETTVSQPPPTSLRRYLSKDNSDEIEAARQVYELLGGRSSSSRLENFDHCKTRSWFTRHVDTGEVKVMSSSCKLRWCPLCSNARKYFLAKQVKEWLVEVDKPKFLTLTLKHSHNDLTSQVDHLYQSFRKLRLMNEYKKLFKGGVWFFQIKKSEADGLWHPHLHCVIESKFVEFDKLWRNWLLITGTSKIVDIRIVKEQDEIAEYVARYAARPSDLAKLAVSDRLELVTALHGRRLVGTWGSARGISLSPSKPHDSDRWKNVGSWWLVATMYGTDIRAKKIWNAFRLSKVLAKEDSLHEFENEWMGKQFKKLEKKNPDRQTKFEFG